MPLHNYAVLKGNVIAYKEGRGNHTPHFQINIEENNNYYRAAVSVQSASNSPDLKYKVVTDFDHYLISGLNQLEDGLHYLPSEKDTLALDYIRGNLFDINDMQLIPHHKKGPKNDLNDLLIFYTHKAIRQEGAKVYVFGECWPITEERDRYFGFYPAQGLHDIHMNQGNSDFLLDDNGIYQDGGLLFYFPEDEQWVGTFLAFQSQTIHTHNQTGHPITKKKKPALVEQEDLIEQASAEEGLRIVAALANPDGKDEGYETVTLLNISDKEINLKGWKLLNQNKDILHLPETNIFPGDSYKIELTSKEMSLSNQGGLLTLLDPEDLKAHGVSYSKEQAQKEGWTILF